MSNINVSSVHKNKPRHKNKQTTDFNEAMKGTSTNLFSILDNEADVTSPPKTPTTPKLLKN